MEDMYARTIRRTVKELEPGQLVLVRRARITRFQLPSSGPYRFVEYADDEKRTAWIEDPTNGRKYKLNVGNLVPMKVSW